jgi:cellobiose transport system permease protein
MSASSQTALRPGRPSRKPQGHPRTRAAKRLARRRARPGSKAAYAYIAPFFLVFAAFSVYPWLDTAWVSLHNVRLTTYDKQTWVGLENYRNLFSNTFFWNALRNTVTIGIISTVPQLCMALGIAHLLNYRLRGRTFFRVAMLMPYATSLAAATVIFLELFDPNLGIVNWALHLLHLPQPDWQSSKWPSQVAISAIITWRWTGYNALIYLAGMQAIDSTLYEAAAIDGASRWQQFRYVTVPGLRPTILFTIVVSTIGAAQLFGEPLLYHKGNPNGGTAGQYQTLGLLMYQQGWANDRLGLASATAWTMFAIIVLAVLLNLTLARRRERRIEAVVPLAPPLASLEVTR